MSTRSCNPSWVTSNVILIVVICFLFVTASFVLRSYLSTPTTRVDGINLPILSSSHPPPNDDEGMENEQPDDDLSDDVVTGTIARMATTDSVPPMSASAILAGTQSMRDYVGGWI